MSKAGKDKRRRDRNKERRAERRCERCGTPLPIGRNYCDHCALLRQVEKEHPDHSHNDFRARPGVTNDQLRDGFPRPLQVWEGGTEGSHTAACDGDDHPGRPCPIDYP